MVSESKMLERVMEHMKSDIDTVKIDLLTGYLDHFATDSVNKYDRGFSLSSTKLKDILSTNQFQTKLRRLGYKLSLHGSGYGLAVFRYDGKSYIEVVRIDTGNVKRKFGRIIDLYFYTEETITIQGKEEDSDVSIQGRFYFDENDKLQKEVGYFSNGSWVVKEDAIEYDTKTIPVFPFDNNSLRTPDINKQSRDMINQAGNFINKIPKEYEKGKVVFAFNNMINSQNNGKDFKSKVIEGGADTFDLTDPDGVIANSVAPITTGMSTIEMIERIFGFYDNRARELSFQFRDHGSDSRKSEFDLMLFNQKPFEYMMSKITHRQDQLQAFIDMLATIEKVDTAKITLKISEFEQNRMDNLKAITDLKVAQAKQAKGVAKKNNAEAEAITNGSATISDPSAISTNLNIDAVPTKGK